MTETPAHFEEIASSLNDIAERYSTDIPLPNEGDIFDIHFGDHVERYAYMGSDKCVPLYPVSGKWVAYALSEHEEFPASWDYLMSGVDDALDSGEEVWVETVLRRNSTLSGLEEKIDDLKKRLLTVKDAVTRVQIKNMIEYLEQ